MERPGREMGAAHQSADAGRVGDVRINGKTDIATEPAYPDECPLTGWQAASVVHGEPKFRSRIAQLCRWSFGCELGSLGQLKTVRPPAPIYYFRIRCGAYSGAAPSL